jgi:hypothetical protein
MKVLIEFITFIVVSSSILLIGYMFNFKLFMLHFKDTATMEFGGSIIPFIIGLICSIYIGNQYKNRRQVY